MKLREKFKRFWTMDVHNHEGFTLVELIIVIAILAILSGVAVAGYSTYIKKANISADKTMVAGIVDVVTLANYDTPLPGVVTIVLQKDGVQLVTDGNTDAEDWAKSVLEAAYGSNYSDLLTIKYDGWGNGVAVANAMLEALNGDKFSAAMENIYGDAGNLSFTEEIPSLMEEVRDVAVELAGEGNDELAILLVGSAAGITANWDVDDIQALWNLRVQYNGSKYTNVDSYIPEGTDAYDAKLTIAGVLRAKNTCLALYAAENGFPEYYDKLASFSYSDNTMVPMDLTLAAGSDTYAQQRLCTVLGLNPDNEADLKVLGQLRKLLGDYMNAVDVNGNKIYMNDAAAYATMMGIVDGLNKDENSPLSSDNLDEYFNAASGAVSMFQQLVMGTLDIKDLTTAMSQLTTTGANISITLIPNGSELEIIVGPTTVLG